MEQALAALMRQLEGRDEASAARVAKALALSRSELQRLLAVLGEDAVLGGLGLVAQRGQGGRQLLSLTPRGREWLARHR